MNYTLSFDNDNKLNGIQKVNYELVGMILEEQQEFYHGSPIVGEAFVQVYDPRMQKSYFFNEKDWGTIENTRNAAEDFSAGSKYNYQYRMNQSGLFWDILPYTEEAFL